MCHLTYNVNTKVGMVLIMANVAINSTANDYNFCPHFSFVENVLQSLIVAVSFYQRV